MTISFVSRCLSVARPVFGSLLLLSFITGCSSTPERNALPPELTKQAAIPGVPEARFWGDEWPRLTQKRFTEYTDAQIQDAYPGIYNQPHNYLTISGGGANGAYGAGLLAGWAAAGNRPEFTMVTGVSTGALTAPFAFLGEDYDDELKEVYTTTTTKQIAKKRNIIAAMISDSMADTSPLKSLIAKYITEDMIEAIAHEHRRGRRLFIGTVNLDAGRSVIWSIGAIADSDYPHKVELIRELMRASAAIPVAFPPVAIAVEANGEAYDELHVDGGTGSQVFVYPAEFDWPMMMKKLKTQGAPNVYVIRNAFLDPDYQGIKRNVMPIAARSIDSLIRTQGIGDLYQIYSLCQRDGNTFNLAYLPATFEEEPAEPFDPVYMSKLYELGYQTAIKGYPWKNSPPDFHRGQ